MKTFDKYEYAFSNQNNTLSNAPCIVVDTLDRRFLPNSEDEYQVAITFMSIPTFDIPIFTFQEYKEAITIDYYDSSTSTRLAIGQALVSLVSRDRNDSNKIYQITQYMEMLNDTIYEAFLACDANYVATAGIHLPNYVGGPTPIFTGMPFMLYNKLTERLTISASQSLFEDDVDLDDGSRGGVFNMYFNVSLFEKVSGLDNFTTGIHSDEIPTPIPIPLTPPENINFGQDFRILFHNNGDNTLSGVITNSQQWPSFSTMNDFTSIQVISNLPIQKQYTNQGNVNTVLAEIQPVDVTLDKFHQQLVYNPPFPYKWRDITSPIQLNDIYFKLYYTTSTSKESLALSYPPNQTVSIRLMFQKKKTSNY